MGCLDYVRRTKSNQRSTEYYRDFAGKEKKKLQNKKRAKNRSPPSPEYNQFASHQSSIMKKYLRFLIHLLEKRWIKTSELDMGYDEIQNRLRQHPLKT